MTPAKRFVAIALLAAAAALLVDMWAIEPYRLEVTHYDLSVPIEAPLTIAHVSDLHTKGFGKLEKEVVEAIDREKPDVIVITGDTVTSGPPPEVVRDTLSRLHAPLGVWLVLGNWEHWREVRDPVSFYEAAGVHLLLNENVALRDDVRVAGFDDFKNGSPDLEAGLSGIPAGAFVISLFHSPAFFDDVAGRTNLALAGHTHGGQIRLPGLPPLWLPRGSGRFVEGWYDERSSRMYVSRGIGTSDLPFRFFCRPELAIIKLVPMTTGTAGHS